MIEQLTAEKLKEYGCDPENIKKLMKLDNYELTFGNKEIFYASNIDGKIYSQIDFFRKAYFKDKNNVQFPFNETELFSEYYNLKLNAYLLTKKITKVYTLTDAKDNFFGDQIENTETVITNCKEQIKTHRDKFKAIHDGREFHEENDTYFPLKTLKGTIEDHKTYLNFLKRMKDEPVYNKLVTLQTNLNEDQIKKLHSLLNGKYIIEISEIHFVYWLTGKPIINTLPKIKWMPAKGMALQLFKNICLNFSYSLLNNCIVTNGKEFDSNNVSKTDYHEIDEILKQVKR